MPEYKQNKRKLQSGSIREYLYSLKNSPGFGPQVVYDQEIKARPARFAALEKPLTPVLAAALEKAGFKQLYTHQAQAINLIRQGKDVIVATPTASGKSLIYNVPVFEEIINNPAAGALYLFPLKALAQDQLKVVRQLAEFLPKDLQPEAAICDGDTSTYQRRKLRENTPQIMITNPDMLHLSFMAYHGIWSQFWAQLRFVIIDEVHTYRGVFGSHMSWVLRRMQRICRLYGADPVFLLFSATVGNPAELARDLLNKQVHVITETGAPGGSRSFVLFNPDDSASYAASQMLEAALKRGLRTIVYTQSRKLTELVSVWTQSRLGQLKKKLAAYRAGYLPEERRLIEEKLNNGELLGVVSTSALELGIDIGALDICIMVGYPGTIMATWQRGGRVGRRRRDSLIIMVAQEDGLDQYFMRHPADFFKRKVEAAVLNPHNPVIMKRHLLCAAVEIPISRDEPLAESAIKQLEQLTESALLHKSHNGNEWYCPRKAVHREVNLRGSGKSFQIRRNDNSILGIIDGHRCLKECHPGAVYLHRGQTWVVDALDLDGHEVRVTRRNVNYFTRTLEHKETEILEINKTLRQKNFQAGFGSLRVTDTVSGFQRRLVRGRKIISQCDLDLPPNIFETEGLWIIIPADLQKETERRQLHFMGGIHAIEHAVIGMMPLLVLCDRNDLGGISYPFHPQINLAAIFVYDGYPGGVGLARQAFPRFEELLRITLETIKECPCETGCPSCVHSPKCGSGNRPIDKEAALFILKGLLRRTGSRVVVKEQVRAETVPVKHEIPSHYGVFDLETQRSAQEVGGWHHAERMGISIGVIYDSKLDDYLVFRENEIDALVNHLRRLKLVVGFNNKRFDNKVLSSYTDFNLSHLPTLDILEVVHKRLGYRLSLDRLAEHTVGAKKSADGLQALKWYKEGRLDLIIEYCRQDVRMTGNLFLFGLKNGYLLFQNKAGKVVRCPVDFTVT